MQVYATYFLTVTLVLVQAI